VTGISETRFWKKTWFLTFMAQQKEPQAAAADDPLLFYREVVPGDQGGQAIVG
jgi:hypothetical protein